MSMTTAQKLEGECRCHISPPCEWCQSLTEDEFDAFAAGGRKALNELLDSKLEAEEPAASPDEDGVVLWNRDVKKGEEVTIRVGSTGLPGMVNGAEDILAKIKAALARSGDGGKVLVVSPPALDRLGKMRALMDAVAAGEIKVTVDKNLSRDVNLWSDTPDRFPPLHMLMMRLEAPPPELPPRYRFNAMEMLRPPRFIGVDWGIDHTPKPRRPRKRVRPCPARKHRMAQAKLDRESNVRWRKRLAELKRRRGRS